MKISNILYGKNNDQTVRYVHKIRGRPDGVPSSPCPPGVEEDLHRLRGQWIPARPLQLAQAPCLSFRVQIYPWEHLKFPISETQRYNATTLQTPQIQCRGGRGSHRGFIFKYYIILKYKSSRLLYQYYHPILTSTPHSSNVDTLQLRCSVVALQWGFR